MATRACPRRQRRGGAWPRHGRSGRSRSLSFLLGLLLLAMSGGTWSWPATDAGTAVSAVSAVSVPAEGMAGGGAVTPDGPSSVAVDVTAHVWSPGTGQPLPARGAAADETPVGDPLSPSIKDRAPPTRAV